MDFGGLWCVNVGSSIVNKFINLVVDVDKKWGYTRVVAEDIWETQ